MESRPGTPASSGSARALLTATYGPAASHDPYASVTASHDPFTCSYSARAAGSSRGADTPKTGKSGRGTISSASRRASARIRMTHSASPAPGTSRMPSVSPAPPDRSTRVLAPAPGGLGACSWGVVSEYH